VLKLDIVHGSAPSRRLPKKGEHNIIYPRSRERLLEWYTGLLLLQLDGKEAL
jgi:hypothetical protein